MVVANQRDFVKEQEEGGVVKESVASTRSRVIPNPK